MRTFKYFLALITPVLSWGLFIFIFYANFSGKVAFYNSLPKHIHLIMIWSIPIIAVLGAAVCIQIFREKKNNTGAIVVFSIPFLLNLTMVALLLFEAVSALFT